MNNIKKIYYCSKCKKNKENNNFIFHLKEKYNDIKFEDKCLSFCGPGKIYFFVDIEGKLIYTEDKDKLLSQIDNIILKR